MQNNLPQREQLVRGAARGAALGGAADAISGNSDSEGANLGAGVGASGVRRARSGRDTEVAAQDDIEQAVKNCMGRQGTTSTIALAENHSDWCAMNVHACMAAAGRHAM